MGGVTEPGQAAVAAQPPVLSGSDAIEVSVLDRPPQWQLVSTALVVLLSWLSVPLGPSGWRLAGTVLLALNTALVMVRHVPRSRLAGRRLVMPLFYLWGLLAAALLGVASNSFAPGFAYLMVGHIGYRLPPRRAGALAAVVAVAAMIALAGARHFGLPYWPWYIGATVGLGVFLGMANRSREEAVRNAVAAARAAQRAAESEARERALAERARISRDIHDVLAHTLSGVSMQLELSEMMFERGDAAAAEQAVGKAHSMVREGMSEAKRAVTALRSGVLPLAETLRSMFDGAGELTVVGATRELPTEIAQGLIRVAQESLTNARRHAPGAVLAASLDFSLDGIELVVENGPGLRPGADGQGSGMGLVGMRERIELLRGNVATGPLDSGPRAGGWRVRAWVPAPPDRPEDATLAPGTRDVSRPAAGASAPQDGQRAERGGTPRIGRGVA